MWPQRALSSVSSLFHQRRVLKVHPCGGACQNSFLFKEGRYSNVCPLVCVSRPCPFIHQWTLGVLPTFSTIARGAAMNTGEQISPCFPFFVELLGSGLMLYVS